MSSNYIFKGIHSDAQNEWLIAVSYNCSTIKATETMCERRRILDGLAKNIHGISDAVVDKALAEFEAEHY